MVVVDGMRDECEERERKKEEDWFCFPFLLVGWDGMMRWIRRRKRRGDCGYVERECMCNV